MFFDCRKKSGLAGHLPAKHSPGCSDSLNRMRSVSFSALVSPALPHGKTYSHLTGEVVDEDWDDGSYDWVEDPDNIYDRRR